jgi:hypothetical protein
VSRTVRDVEVGPSVPADVGRFVSDWLNRNGFRILNPVSDGAQEVVSHWDGNLLIRPHPGRMVAVRERVGGGAVVFEIGLPTASQSRTLHFEGWVTGRGIGWKGKEYEFLPSALAVAGVVRKQGLELLGKFESAMSAGPGAGLSTAPPVWGIATSPTVATGAPLPSTLPSGSPSRGPKPYDWTDRRVPTKPFPFRQATNVGPLSAVRLQAVVCDAIRAQGFEVTLDTPPEFDGKPPTNGRFDRHRGLVVAERGLHLDLPLRRRSFLTTGLLVVGGVALGGFGFTALSNPPESELFILPAGLMFGAALTTYTGAAVFDSDLVWVQYSPSVRVSPPPSDTHTPYPYEIKIGAGSVVSRNWAGRGASGRNLKRLVAPTADLGPIPRDLARGIESRAAS